MQLNAAEFEQLKSKALSHMARSLYILYLQPLYAKQDVFLDLVSLSSALSSQSKDMPCKPDLRDIEAALYELEEQGLIARVHPNSPWENAEICFPLYTRGDGKVPARPFRMYLGWQPGHGFRNAALQAGLINRNYREEELLEFVNYWSSKSTERNQHAWELAFVRRLIRLNTAAVSNPRYRIRPRYDDLAPNANTDEWLDDFKDNYHRGSSYPTAQAAQYLLEQEASAVRAQLRQRAQQPKNPHQFTGQDTPELPLQTQSANASWLRQMLPIQRQTSYEYQQAQAPESSYAPAANVDSPAELNMAAQSTWSRANFSAPHGATPECRQISPTAPDLGASQNYNGYTENVSRATSPSTPAAQAQSCSAFSQANAPHALADTNVVSPPYKQGTSLAPSPFNLGSASAYIPTWGENSELQPNYEEDARPTAYREQRPSISSIYTGKAEYTSIARGYTDPAKVNRKDPRHIGAQPASISSEYTDPRVRKSDNPAYSGRMFKGEAAAFYRLGTNKSHEENMAELNNPIAKAFGRMDLRAFVEGNNSSTNTKESTVVPNTAKSASAAIAPTQDTAGSFLGAQSASSVNSNCPDSTTAATSPKMQGMSAQRTTADTGNAPQRPDSTLASYYQNHARSSQDISGSSSSSSSDY